MGPQSGTDSSANTSKARHVISVRRHLTRNRPGRLASRQRFHAWCLCTAYRELTRQWLLSLPASPKPVAPRCQSLRQLTQGGSWASSGIRLLLPARHGLPSSLRHPDCRVAAASAFVCRLRPPAETRNFPTSPIETGHVEVCGISLFHFLSFDGTRTPVCAQVARPSSFLGWVLALCHLRTTA